MSLTAFKNKSVIQYGSKRSGKPPGGYWLPQGPFGHSTQNLKNAINNYGSVGFSINGGHRNVGYIGKSYKMSKSGTPFRGQHPIGWGGTYGRYPRSAPLLNSQEVDTLGQQYLYIKPSVLSTYGMLRKKYRWAYNGKYPNYWVQPIYTGNQTNTASEGLYIQNKASANTNNLKVNNVGTYEGYIVGNGHYTKTLYQPVSYTQYNLHLTRGCNNPIGPQKPFPFAVQTGTSINSGLKPGGTSIVSGGNACNTSNIYVTPPSWYTSFKPSQVWKQEPSQKIPLNI